ncbi:MAG: cytochrome b/b6 domain-containing protein [Myxococcales bacterium]
MQRVLVWDLVVRAFHWFLVATLVATFAFALGTDDESAAFSWHMALGLVAAALVVLRLGWGLVGTRWARFSSFVFGPSEVLRYLRSSLPGAAATRYVGHNPGSSVAIFSSLALVVGLGLTGLAMSNGSHAAEEMHEVLAYSLLAVVGLHLAGVAWHWLRHRENLTRSMIDGRKQAMPDEAIASSSPVAASIFVALSAGVAATVIAGHSPSTRQLTLPLISTTLTLGGDRGGEHGDGHDRQHDEREDHD